MQADQLRHRLVEINNPPVLIHHQHAVLNGIEQRLEKTSFARQPLDTVCKPSVSSRPMRPRTLSRKLDFVAIYNVFSAPARQNLRRFYILATSAGSVNLSQIAISNSRFAERRCVEDQPQRSI